MLRLCQTPNFIDNCIFQIGQNESLVVVNSERNCHLKGCAVIDALQLTYRIVQWKTAVFLQGIKFLAKSF